MKWETLARPVETIDSKQDFFKKIVFFLTSIARVAGTGSRLTKNQDHQSIQVSTVNTGLKPLSNSPSHHLPLENL